MKSPEWAFVDLENIGSLNKISIPKYDVVYVFVGAKQSGISLIPESSERFTDIKILKLEDISKNNLDFHLTYYLGQLDSKAKKEVTFTIISNDAGFDNLITHINKTGRKCVRLKVEHKEDIVTKEILLGLLSRDIKKTPKTEQSLKNYIKSHLGNNNSNKKIETTYNSVVKNKKIANRIKSI